MKLRLLQICLLLHLIIFTNYAQSPLRFNHISIAEGLSQTTVNTIIQDQLGFMWFATQDGLNRFDGYRFKVFKHVIGDSSSLTRSNWPVALANDPFGRLWVGTLDGLSVYQHETENFKHLSFEGEEIIHRQIKALLVSRDSVMWIGSVEGISKGKFNEKGELILTHFKPEAGQELGVNTLFEDAEGNVWVGTNNGVLKFAGGEIGGKEGVGVELFQDKTKHGVLAHHYITAITQDQKGHLWVGTQYGLTVITTTGEYIRQFNHNEQDPTSLSDNWIESLFTDSKGRTWVGTYTNGLCLYDHENQKFHWYRHEVGNPKSLSGDDVIRGIYEDNSGIIWVGTLLWI